MKKLLSRRVIFILSLLAMIIFAVSLLKLQIFPLKYSLPMIAFFMILIFILYHFEKDNSHLHRIRTVILKSIHILISIFLVIGSLSMIKGNNFLASITGLKNQVMEVEVLVLNSSSYQEVGDLTRKKIGANMTVDGINMNKAFTMLENDVEKVELVQFNSYENVVDELKKQGVDAIMVKSVDTDLLKDIDKDIQNKVRVLHKIEVVLPHVKANAAKVTQEPFNVFITGRDKKGPIDTFSLSDVNMIATINPVTKQILLTSIPRDYYVDIIGMDGVSGKDKLTHSARGGTDVSIKTVENLMDMKINYYAKFNFTSFLNVIDALDGIDVEVPQYQVIGRNDGVFTTVKGHYTIRPGKTHMDSKKALAFVRERKSFVLGDEIRGKNQMLMLKAIIKKCSSSPTKMNDVLEKLADSFETNMESTDIQNLIKMQIDDMAPWDIQTYHLDGDGSKRATNLAIVGDVTSLNPRGIVVSLPLQKSVDQGKEYIKILMEGQVPLKIKN